MDRIKNYCQIYGVTVPQCGTSNSAYFVAIDTSEARVYPYKQSKLLGQVIGSAMKRGVVFYVRDGWVKPLIWEEWRGFWSRHFAPQKHKNNNLPEPYRAPKYKRSAFDEGKGARQSEKPSKRGFETTYTANTNLYRLG
ncbi:MAG: hypothetical protein SNJ29_13700 [Rikenellaceae bacterium]